MSSPTFSALTVKEQEWVQSQLDALPILIEAYAPECIGIPVTLAVLDRAFASWLAASAGDNDEVNATINIIGIRFGQFLVDNAGFQWVIAKDSDGTDLAVLALPGRGDLLVYPANFVAKRWEKRESNFLATAFDDIKQQVQQVNAFHSHAERRPWWRFW